MESRNSALAAGRSQLCSSGLRWRAVLRGAIQSGLWWMVSYHQKQRRGCALVFAYRTILSFCQYFLHRSRAGFINRRQVCIQCLMSSALRRLTAIDIFFELRSLRTGRLCGTKTFVAAVPQHMSWRGWNAGGSWVLRNQSCTCRTRQRNVRTIKKFLGSTRCEASVSIRFHV